jgi:hypothetical protein
MEVKQKIPTMEGPAVYRIRVGGRVEADWSDRLAGMTITTSGGRDSPDTTTLEGGLSDQAALNGVMNTLYELHLPVLSMECVEIDDKEEGD